LYACDAKWWDWHEGTDFQGRKITQDIKAVEKYGIEHIESKPGKGLSTDPKIIHQGSNSGYQAINLAYHLGAKHIILLGYDMGKAGNKSHWFGDHPDKQPSSYDQFIRNFDSISSQLTSIGLAVTNCTRKTQLKCFPLQKLTDVL